MTLAVTRRPDTLDARIVLVRKVLVRKVLVRKTREH
jgi:hypothetical protein